jgi:hypothetical protein
MEKVLVFMAFLGSAPIVAYRRRFSIERCCRSDWNVRVQSLLYERNGLRAWHRGRSCTTLNVPFVVLER